MKQFKTINCHRIFEKAKPFYRSNLRRLLLKETSQFIFAVSSRRFRLTIDKWNRRYSYTSTLIDVVRFDTIRIRNEIDKKFSKIFDLYRKYSFSDRLNIPKICILQYSSKLRNSAFFALFIAFIAFLVNLWMNLKHVSSLSIDF
jgi:hypothetical protein